MRPTGPSLSDQADALVAAGRVGEAYRLLTGAAAAADPEALVGLANWRLSGQLVRRDLPASRDLFRRAAEAGHKEAARVHTAFVANGTGAPADWQEALRLLRLYDFPGAAAQRALIDRMHLSPSGDPLERPAEKPLSDRPRVGRFAALFSPAECNFLAAEAELWLARSVVIDPQTGRQHRNPVRTSDGMSFALFLEGPAVHALNRRIAAATGTNVAQGETLQVLRYRPGQEYRPHFDAVPGEANQRILTLLVYLNEGYDGGETVFLKTGLSFKGRKGDALLFRNTLADGRADELTQHAGRPVAAGEKLIASRWIRARPFTFPPPRPLLDL
ncbi:MAG: prolyl 4-hydroxylase [Sphingomonadales bacterium]|jgi:prolyl 4-hydroxylase|nr:prolyl 4-hydroxylase [Sphingomonadales bacterium]